MKPVMTQKGFTLMEVLIATAITGIALGVIISIISQGHREFLRGTLAEEAGNIANQLVLQLSNPDTWKGSSGTLDNHPDWIYEIKPVDVISVRDLVPGIGEREIKIEEDLMAVDITLKPPQEATHFVLSAYYPKIKRQETIQTEDPGRMPARGSRAGSTGSPFPSTGPAPFPFGR